MTKKKILNIIFVFLGLLFFLFFWEISSRIYNSNSVFPSFIESLMNLVNLLKDINLYKSLFFTIGLGLLGVLISIIFGIIFGILAYYFELFRAFFSPINKIYGLARGNKTLNKDENPFVSSSFKELIIF